MGSIKLPKTLVFSAREGFPFRDSPSGFRDAFGLDRNNLGWQEGMPSIDFLGVRPVPDEEAQDRQLSGAWMPVEREAALMIADIHDQTS